MAGRLQPEFPAADPTAASLLARLWQFCFPAGEDAARGITAVRTAEQGEMRMSPEARWIPFTAEQTIQARHSGFRWVARLHSGRLTPVTVTDAYEDGHGWLALKAAAVIPLKRMTGADVDQGELQRYLASIVICPPILLHHGSLRWTAAGPSTLRILDQNGPAAASLDLELSQEGRPVICRAERPRMAGKRSIITPWWGSYLEFREWEGMRVASRLEVGWQLAEGPFIYFRGEVTAFTVLR